MRRSIIAVLTCVMMGSPAFAQQSILQGGPWTSGHVPMYVGPGNSQPVVQDGGPAGGAGLGGTIGELGITMRSPTGSYPAQGTGTGALGTPFCLYDAPINNSTGYHYLCLGPNDSANAGVIDFGAAGGASTIPFNFVINGATYTFPFVVGGIVGPNSSVVNDAACWNNTTGTLLKDCGTFVQLGSTNAWTGTNSWSGASNFTGTFQINSGTQTFPASGNLVGTSDSQTLTNKSIAASQINSGTLSAAQSWALTGNVTSSAGSSATTIANGVITNAMYAAMTQNALKGAATSTTETDIAVPSCSAAGNALQWTAGAGFACGSFTNQTAGWGLTGSSTFSISTSQPPYGFDGPVNLGLTASVGASALTINVVGANGSNPSATNPVCVPFRSTTLATGAPVWSCITSALSIVVPSAATLGTSNSVPFRIWIFLEYNSGTPEIGVATCSTTTQLYPCAGWEATRITSTSITGFATSAGVLYSPTGVSNDAVRIIGYADYASGLATAGSYASVPTTLQLMGPGIKKPGDTVQGPIPATSSTTAQSTSTTKVQANPSVAITPTSAANLIRVHAVGNIELVGSSQSCMAALSRSTSFTALTNSGTAAFITGSSAGASGVPMPLFGLDAPGSVSATTYVPFLWSGAGATTCNWNNTGGSATPVSYIEVEEIMGALEPDNDNEVFPISKAT